MTRADVECDAVIAGRYVLGERLGSGGAADVFRGRDLVLGRGVAVKVVRSDAFDEARHAEEMRTLAGLSHPGLVTLYDAGSADGHGYFVMELVAGPTLAAAGCGRPMEPSRVAAIGATVADALAYVHRRGIVHRDVKPGNVLIARSGRAKLADFGIARAVDSAHLTTTGLKLGTAAYLAPEQITGAAVGAPADVYSLGLVLLEGLTGRREYDGTGLEVALARLNRAPVVPAWLPVAWRELLAAMTARQPAERVTAATAATRLRALNAVGDPLAASSPAAVRTTAALSTAPIQRQRSSRKSPVALGLALAATLLIAVAGVMAVQWRAQHPAAQPTVAVHADSRQPVASPRAPSSPPAIAPPASPLAAPVAADPAPSAVDPTTAQTRGVTSPPAGAPPTNPPPASAGQGHRPSGNDAAAAPDHVQSADSADAPDKGDSKPSRKPERKGGGGGKRDR